jgi:small-conductance mechanosensitive channel
VDKLNTVIGIQETSQYIIFFRVFIVPAGLYLVWLVFKLILSLVEKKTSQYEFVRTHFQIFNIIRRLILCVLILIAGTYFIRLFNIQLVEKFFFAIIIVFFAAPVKDFTIIILKYLEKNIADRTDTKMDNIVFDLLNKFSSVIVFATAGILALDILGINVMPFIAGAGVVGIAIGFAAKDTLSNLIAGILLIIDRPFETGDRIEVWSAPAGSATWGDVIDIGLRATKIRTTDNIIIIIPNNEIMKRDIVNYTIINSKIRVRINIGISYDADIEKAKAVILKVADSADWILKDPTPQVVVKNFGESSVDLQLRVWIADARKRIHTISYVTDNLKGAFDKAGIEIPYPKRDIIITQKPAPKNE